MALTIFWQRRIRADDDVTPWWFPSKTNSGSIREDRIVLPIPPGTHWSEAMPVVLPGEWDKDEGRRMKDEMRKALPGPKQKKQKAIKPTKAPRGGLWFTVAKTEVSETKREREDAPREPKRKTKNDPRLVAAARELRDRWLEHVNTNEAMLLANAKYEVGRVGIEARSQGQCPQEPGVRRLEMRAA